LFNIFLTMNNAIALLHSKNESYLLIMTYPVDDGQPLHVNETTY